MKLLKELIPIIINGLVSGKLKTLAGIKAFFYSISEKVVVKAALKHFAKGILKGAFGNWLITFLAVELMEEFGKKFINTFFNLAGYGIKKIEGGFQVKKLEQAEREGNREAYNKTIYDIMD